MNHGRKMGKVLKKSLEAITAVTVAVCMAMSVSAIELTGHGKAEYKCAICNTITTSKLDVTEITATASTSINVRQGVSISINASYYEKGTFKIKKTGNGNGGLSGASTSISNYGGIWMIVESSYSQCCSGRYGTLTIPN